MFSVQGFVGFFSPPIVQLCWRENGHGGVVWCKMAQKPQLLISLGIPKDRMDHISSSSQMQWKALGFCDGVDLCLIGKNSQTLYQQVWTMSTCCLRDFYYHPFRHLEELLLSRSGRHWNLGKKTGKTPFKGHQPTPTLLHIQGQLKAGDPAARTWREHVKPQADLHLWQA